LVFGFARGLHHLSDLVGGNALGGHRVEVVAVVRPQLGRELGVHLADL
jgi:hypothetical protein